MWAACVFKQRSAFPHRADLCELQQAGVFCCLHEVALKFICGVEYFVVLTSKQLVVVLGLED